MDAQNTPVFTLGAANRGTFQLSSCSPAQHGSALRGSAASGTCCFTTRPAAGAGRKLFVRRPAARGALTPFASLSLASVTLGSTGATPATPPAKKKKSIGEIVDTAAKKALRGGLPGMAAMAIQVFALMWLRTTINYQYRYGTSTMTALSTLYKEGGIPRFYQGLLPALLQGPLSRFGDTAANTGTLALLEDVDIPVGLKTVAASLAAGLFRIFLMPVDALKTIMQVEGAAGAGRLAQKLRVGGPTVLYHGALAASAATFVGHYPWFATYNTLDAALPQYDPSTEKVMRMLRSAFIGFCASFISDCCSNSIRVIKTAKQTVTTPMTYAEVVKMVIEKDGVGGLFGRGLRTKIISNGIQGVMFSVLWRLGQDAMAAKDKEKAAADKAAADAAAAAAAPPSKKRK